MVSRNYPNDTIAMLWSRSGGVCAYPQCEAPVIEQVNGTHHIIGEIAHIFAISSGGSRANSQLTKTELNDHPNLLLLCPNHHTKIDKFPSEYPPQLLLDWKAAIELRWQKTYLALLPEIAAAEIEMVVKFLLAAPMAPTQDLSITPIAQKMTINGFSRSLSVPRQR